MKGIRMHNFGQGFFVSLIVAILFGSAISSAQEITYPRVRSLQLDVVTIGFSTSYVAGFDFDLIPLRSKEKIKPGHTMGIKLQAAKVNANSVGGGSMDAWDMDLFARHSMRTESFVFDLYVGPSYSISNSYHESGVNVKAGFDLRYLFSKFLGLDAKLAVSGVSHNVGLGVTVGYFD